MIFVADKVSTILSDSASVMVWLVVASILSLVNFGLLFWNILRPPTTDKPVPLKEMAVPRPPKALLKEHGIDADIARHREAFEREMRSDAPPPRRIILPPIEIPVLEERPRPPMPTVQELKNIKLTDEPVEEPELAQEGYDDPYYTGGY
jgi:hypothetical protein